MKSSKIKKNLNNLLDNSILNSNLILLLSLIIAISNVFILANQKDNQSIIILLIISGVMFAMFKKINIILLLLIPVIIVNLLIIVRNQILLSLTPQEKIEGYMNNMTPPPPKPMPPHPPHPEPMPRPPKPMPPPPKPMPRPPKPMPPPPKPMPPPKKKSFLDSFLKFFNQTFYPKIEGLDTTTENNTTEDKPSTADIKEVTSKFAADSMKELGLTQSSVSQYEKILSAYAGTVIQGIIENETADDAYSKIRTGIMNEVRNRKTSSDDGPSGGGTGDALPTDKPPAPVGAVNQGELDADMETQNIT
uniref:Uncharacterized protein n=1 Tax=Florenciella sp. virus SA2 TaxID=3240092 RepID=A0AB39JED4_9VIRU